MASAAIPAGVVRDDEVEGVNPRHPGRRAFEHEHDEAAFRGEDGAFGEDEALLAAGGQADLREGAGAEDVEPFGHIKTRRGTCPQYDPSYRVSIE